MHLPSPRRATGLIDNTSMSSCSRSRVFIHSIVGYYRKKTCGIFQSTGAFASNITPLFQASSLSAASSSSPGKASDPFVGSGTAIDVATKLGRHAVGIDMGRQYVGEVRKYLEQNGAGNAPEFWSRKRCANPRDTGKNGPAIKRILKAWDKVVVTTARCTLDPAPFEFR